MEDAVLLAHACRDNPEPKDDTAPTLAFDRLQVPVLTSHLLHEDFRVVEAGLVSLQRLLADASCASKVHEAGAVEVLAALGKQEPSAHTLNAIRMALNCLRLLVSSPALRCESIAVEAVPDCWKLAMASSDAASRQLVYDAIAVAAETHDACALLVRHGFIADLIPRLTAESADFEHPSQLWVAVLQPLRRLLALDDAAVVPQAIDCAAVPALVAVLPLTAPATGNVVLVTNILRLAMECLMSLAVCEAGRRAIIDTDEAVPLLCSLCDHADLATATAAAGVCMRITVEDDCKHVATQHGFVPAAGRLILRATEAAPAKASTAVIYAANALTNVCSYPLARAALASDARAMAALRAVAVGSAGGAAALRPSVLAASVMRAASAAVRAAEWLP